MKYITKKRLISGIVVSVIAVIGIFGIHQITAPSHGHFTVPTARPISSRKQPPPPPAASQQQSPYYTLSLPTGYRAQPGSTTIADLLYAQTITKASSAGTLVIAVAIHQGNDLAHDSGYSQRIANPEHYTMTQQTVAGETVHIANDKLSAAVVAYWGHGDKLATIGISSGVENPVPDGNENELAALQPVLSGWQWR